MKLTIRSLSVLAGVLEGVSPDNIESARIIIDVHDAILKKLIKYNTKIQKLEQEIKNLNEGQRQLQPKPDEIGSDGYLKITAKLKECRKEFDDIYKKRVKVDIESFVDDIYYLIECLLGQNKVNGVVGNRNIIFLWDEIENNSGQK